MGKFKIVFVDDILPITDVEKNIIEGFGCELTQYSAFETKDILEVAADADAIMTIGGKFNRETIEGLKNCKVISRFGQGFDNVDVKAATEKGIVVTYVPVYCREEVATLALTLMLACERRLLIADKTVKSGHWVDAAKSVNGARSVSAKTIGLIGLGSIQKQLVTYLKAFGCKLISYDPYINLEFCKANGIEPVEKEYLLQNADTVFVQVPLMESTWHMIAEKELAITHSPLKIYQIRTSGSKRMPVLSKTFCATSASTCFTSSAVALPKFTTKPACFVETAASPTW